MARELMNWDPFRELDDMTERMNRLFSRSLAGSTPSAWTGLPSTDIYEEDGRLVIETALPHFQDDEVDVQVNQNRLEIKAEHRGEDEKKSRNYLRRESSSASYYRQFALPEDIDVDSAEAQLENGMLRVTFNHKELPQPKKLALTGTKKESKKLESGKSEK